MYGGDGVKVEPEFDEEDRSSFPSRRLNPTPERAGSYTTASRTRTVPSTGNTSSSCQRKTASWALPTLLLVPRRNGASSAAPSSRNYHGPF